MDTSKHNLRSNFLFLLLVISSFPLFAQKQTTVNKATTQMSNAQTGTALTNTDTSQVQGLLILQDSTTKVHQALSTHGQGLQVSHGNQTNTLVNCPKMYVQVNVPFLQSCISSSAQIDFCNHGTATAFGAFVEVELPAELFLDSADLPYTIVGTNLYRFQLGTVAASICNQFEIHFTTDCDSTLIGDEHCIQAHIYPDTLCNSVQNAPLITVDANCTTGKTTFTLNNHGTTVTSSQHMQLVIIDDHLIAGGTPTTYVDDTLELKNGETATRGFTPGHDSYALTITDGLGNQLVHSRVNNCYVGSPNVLINTFHTHQHLNQFGNGGLLPSISEGCAINGNSTTQTSSTFAPSNNTTFRPNGGANVTENQDDASNLEHLETAETTVLVFPNPFNQYATVKIEGPISNRFMFRLYDSMGRTVQMIEIEGQKEFQIERGDLLQGMYLYQIEAEGKLIGAGKLLIK